MILKRLTCFLFSAFAFLISIVPVQANNVGMWLSVHNEIGDIFFRIKSDNTCSYFLGKGRETPIIKGTWEEIATGIELKFEDGMVISFGTINEELADARYTFPTDFEVSSNTAVMQAIKLNDRSIGRMTVDPNASDDDDEDREGFFGAWEGELISGEKFYFYLQDNRTAAATVAFSEYDASEEHQNVIGFWRKDGSRMNIFWNDGSYTEIGLNGRRVEQTTIRSGELLETAKGFTSRLLPISVDDLPTEWKKNFDQDFIERVSFAVLRNPSQIRAFFHGQWNIGTTPYSEDTIKLRRFSNAWTSRYGGVKGKWRPDVDAAVIFWNNGVREIIRPVGNQFLVSSFNPDQPTTGRPARIDVVNPDDEDTLAYYINRKRELIDPRSYGIEIPTAQNSEG